IAWTGLRTSGHQDIIPWSWLAVSPTYLRCVSHFVVLASLPSSSAARSRAPDPALLRSSCVENPSSWVSRFPPSWLHPRAHLSARSSKTGPLVLRRLQQLSEWLAPS